MLFCFYGAVNVAAWVEGNTPNMVDPSGKTPALCFIPFVGPVACGTAAVVYGGAAAATALGAMWANPCSHPNYRRGECEALARTVEDICLAPFEAIDRVLNPPGVDVPEREYYPGVNPLDNPAIWTPVPGATPNPNTPTPTQTPPSNQTPIPIPGNTLEPAPGATPSPTPNPGTVTPSPTPGTPSPTPNGSRQVLVLGESDSFVYASELATMHMDWHVVGTKFGMGGNTQQVIAQVGNLTLVDDVDGSRLGSGSYTSTQRFDDIVFNAPRAMSGWRGAAGDLVEDVLNSSLNVLSRPGHARFSSGGGMPAVPRLNSLVRPGNLPEGYSSAVRIPYLSDVDFGVPSYQPTNNDGNPLNLTVDDLSWYIFGV